MTTWRSYSKNDILEPEIHAQFLRQARRASKQALEAYLEAQWGDVDTWLPLLERALLIDQRLDQLRHSR